MRKLVKLDKETDNKHLNLYRATFDVDGKDLHYYIASRRNPGDLSCEGSEKVDAVRAIPYFVKNGKVNVLLIREFRYAVGDYIYATMAGLIDEGESPEVAVVRELREETGAKAIRVVRTSGASFSSPGMTDERLVCFEIEIEDNFASQELGESEDIETLIVPLDDLEGFIDGHTFGLQSELQLRGFIYKKKYEDMLSKR